MVKTAENTVEYEKILEIVKGYDYKKSNLIAILQKVQAEYRYLPEAAIQHIAKLVVGVSEADVYGVATFYSQFSLDPKGKYEIKVCDGTACHVRGSMPVYNAIVKKLNLTDGKFTTEDMKFSLETVNCIGACALAPAVLINDKVYSQVTPDTISMIIDELLSRDE